jgi:hypothetical protein
MISAKLAGLFLALLLIFASLGIVEARQLFLNVYVDNTNTKQVLVVGNVDDTDSSPPQHPYFSINLKNIAKVN